MLGGRGILRTVMPVPVPRYGGRGIRNFRNRGEHGVEHGFARGGNSGPILRQLFLKQCQIATLARLGLRVPTRSYQ